MTILAIDTSTPNGSVALLRDGAVLLEERFAAARGASALLFPILEKASAAAGERVEQVVIGLGPGSYAGVRIAIAAALGFEIGLGAKLVGIASVAALETEARRYIAIGDARRATFYFTVVEDGVCTEGPLLLTEADLRARLESVQVPVLCTEPVPGFAEAIVVRPDALRLARLAEQECGIVMRGELEPIYLREPHITQPKARA